MKRIYNDIPLQSILFLVPGTTKIIIEDYTKSALFDPHGGTPVYKWEGKACDAYAKVASYKYLYAKAQGVELSPDDPGTIVFKVSTEFEQY